MSVACRLKVGKQLVLSSCRKDDVMSEQPFPGIFGMHMIKVAQILAYNNQMQLAFMRIFELLKRLSFSIGKLKVYPDGFACRCFPRLKAPFRMQLLHPFITVMMIMLMLRLFFRRLLVPFGSTVVMLMPLVGQQQRWIVHIHCTMNVIGTANAERSRQNKSEDRQIRLAILY